MFGLLSRGSVRAAPLLRHNVCGRMRLSSLVYVELRNGEIDSGTLNAVTAARTISDKVVAVVAGSNSATAALHMQKILGVTKVVVAADSKYDHAMPEPTAELLRAVRAHEGASHVFAAHSAAGKNVLPRLAALEDVQAISDVVAIEDPHTFVRPVYAGNALATVRTRDEVVCVTVRTSSFAAAQEGGEAMQEEAPQVEARTLSTWLRGETAASERPDLAAAQRVVSGGRAVKSAEGFGVIYALADKLGAAVGASRAAVDAGYCDNSLQVGQTGRIVAPELYVAVGISGAIQHLAGMKDSKVIVAINKDADAPIFQVADYGLVGDLFTIVPELTEKL
ncbi:Electron transfer flavoprotein alpha-subunit [Coemansia sp. RSA 720]|nr:Electron transfer flavoprotein alpha-subunit [Coemansia sp. RSA 638]KAJ2123266.1 Electron transfer flavoprotein alpha-subunit [Coemansia sp. RSA 720]